MILSVVALGLAILSMVLLLVGHLQYRRGQATFADTEHTLAALARVQGKPDDAERHEARAAAHARQAWPFKARYGSVETDVPAGQIKAEHPELTIHQATKLIEGWRETYGVGPATKWIIHLPKPRRHWWQRRRARRDGR